MGEAIEPFRAFGTFHFLNIISTLFVLTVGAIRLKQANPGEQLQETKLHET